MNTKKLLALYGLKWNPFSPELPYEALLATPRIEHFAWRVEQLVQEGGFALITGESGTGKSVALRIVAGRLATLRDAALTDLHVLPGVPEDRPIRGRADHLGRRRARRQGRTRAAHYRFDEARLRLRRRGQWVGARARHGDRAGRLDFRRR